LEEFQAFTSALEDKAVNITDRNFSGLLQLSKEFGFQILLMKLSNRGLSPGLTEVCAKSPPAAGSPSALAKFPSTGNYDVTTTSDVPLVSISLLQKGIRRDEFMFIVNHTPFPTSVVEAVVLSPAVCEQLQVDACGRRFVISDPEIDSTDFTSLQSLLSGVDTVLQKSHWKSLLRLSRQLGNVGLERFFFCLWNNSTVNSTVTLSNVFDAHSRVSLHSISDISLLSVDALDSLFSSKSFVVDNQDLLLRLLVPLGHPDLLRHIQWEFVSTAAIASLCEYLTESLWLAVADRVMHPPPPPGFDSLIVSEFPSLLEEFRMKRWLLLWRGSRDDFTTKEFHRRCDGHANTLTFILDTKGNMFGGFTPVEWESRVWNRRYDENNCWKGDDSLRSFLMTLRNPHDVPPRKFALKEEKKEMAIRCDSLWCAVFGDEIGVSDFCNTNSESYTEFGTNSHDNNRVYANDVDFGSFFTGAEEFTVKEIEVFEITN
jgi:hypothetical protein